MEVKDYHEGKIIVLSKAFDTRAKILNIVYFILFTGLAIGVATIGAPSFGDSIGLSVFILVLVVGAYLFAGYRFINKALQTEKLIVNENTLTIIKLGFFSEKTQSYHTDRIYNFRHLDKSEITRHPLAGQTFDYLGFETQQQVINEMHGDARLAFDYDSKTITFGENVFSWNFEELEAILYHVTGRDFKNSDRPNNGQFAEL